MDVLCGEKEDCGNVFFSALKRMEEPVVVGIDEAGRGPVVGYMVYCALVLPLDVAESVRFVDSKTLTHAQRMTFFESIEKAGFGYVCHCSHPDYITEMMLSGTASLNEVSEMSVLRMLNEVRRMCSDVRAVYVDALGACDGYRKRLEGRFPYKFVVEEKADSKFRVVSGASIIAKVRRDLMLAEFGGDIGSGYPSDPVTISWLKRNVNKVFGFPRGVRHSWATAKKMLGERKSNTLGGSLKGFYLDSE